MRLGLADGGQRPGADALGRHGRLGSRRGINSPGRNERRVSFNMHPFLKNIDQDTAVVGVLRDFTRERSPDVSVSPYRLSCDQKEVCLKCFARAHQFQRDAAHLLETSRRIDYRHYQRYVTNLTAIIDSRTASAALLLQRSLLRDRERMLGFSTSIGELYYELDLVLSDGVQAIGLHYPLLPLHSCDDLLRERQCRLWEVGRCLETIASRLQKMKKLALTVGRKLSLLEDADDPIYPRPAAAAPGRRGSGADDC